MGIFSTKTCFFAVFFVSLYPIFMKIFINHKKSFLAVLFVVSVSLTATAQPPASPTGTFNIGTGVWSSGDAATHGCTFDGTILTVNNNAHIVVTGTAGVNRRVVVNGTASITLENISIQSPGLDNSAILLNNTNTSLTLTLLGDNTLRGGSNGAGIQVSAGRTLTITGQGSLTAQGGREFDFGGGAGIGGTGGGATLGSNAGTIIINSGTITATGGAGEVIGGNPGIGGGAGIGGGGNKSGAGGNGGTITINGGTITIRHTGGLASDGAGIGGGAGGGSGVGGNSGTITINNGTISISSNNRGAGIGGGGSSSGTAGAGNNITIHNGQLDITTTSGAGIGGGANQSNQDRGGAGGTITIHNGRINTSSSDGGAGIGAGRGFIGTQTNRLTLNGNAIVYGGTLTPRRNSTANAGATTNTTLLQGILFVDGIGTAHGNLILERDMEVRRSHVLYITDGSSLIIPANITLANNGWIVESCGKILFEEGSILRENKIEISSQCFSNSSPPQFNAIYGQTLADLLPNLPEVLSAPPHVDGRFSWFSPTNTPFGNVRPEPYTFFAVFEPANDGYSDAFYFNSHISVNVIVVPKELTIEGFDISKTYDGDDTVRHFGVLTLNGLFGNETATVNTSNLVARYALPDYGTHDVAFSGHFTVLGSGANQAISSNYTVKLPTGIRGDIEKRPVTVTNFGITKIYDGNDEVTTFGAALSFTNLVRGQTASANVGHSTAIYTDVNVDTGIHIVFANVDFSMNADGSANPNNYTIIQPTDEVTGRITARPLTIIPETGQKKVFGELDPLPFKYTTSEELIAGNTFSGALGREPGENVLTYPYRVGTLSAGNNYSLNVGSSATFEIMPANPVLPPFPLQITAVHGQTLADIDLTSYLTEEHTSGTLRWIVSSDRMMRLDSMNQRPLRFELVFIPTDDHNFIHRDVFANITVMPKPITWNTDGQVDVKEYDGTTSATVLKIPTLNGVLLTDTGNVDILPGSVCFAEENASTSASVIAENWRIGGPLSYRYTISEQPEFEKGAITPKPLTVSGSGVTKPYDGDYEVKGGLGSFAFAGFVGSETASANVSGITNATYASADVGIHNIEFIGKFALNTDGTANPNNYIVTHPIEIKGSIIRRELTITGTGISKIYDGNNTVVNGFGELRFVGLVDDETATVNTSGITAARYASSNFGTHNITFTGNFAMNSDGSAKIANYSIVSTVGIKGDIEKKPITVDFDITKVYDGNNEVTGFGILAFNGLVGTQTASVNIANSCAIYTDANAGAAINIEFTHFDFRMNADGTADTNNYVVVLPSQNVVGEITPRLLTIFPDFGQYKRHEDPDPEEEFGYTSSEELIEGNVFTGRLGRAPGEEIGVYVFTLENPIHGNLSAGDNYSLTVGGNARFEIINANLKLPETPIRLTAAYGDSLYDIDIVTPLTDEHTAGFFAWEQQFNGLVGMVTPEQYPRILWLWFEPDSANRDGTRVPVALTVIPKPLAWGTDGTVFAKTYDGHTDAIVEITPSLIGILESDMAQVNMVTGTVNFADSNANTTVEIIAQNWDIEGDRSFNYSISEQPKFASQTINKKELTIEAEGISKIYDGEDEVIYTSDNLSFVGFVNDETAKVDIFDVEGTYTSPNSGTHDITFVGDFKMMFEGGTANPDNYKIVHPTEIKGDITKKELTISGFDISKIYDGDDIVKNGFGTLNFVGLVDGQTAEVDALSVSATYFSSDFGTHAITFSGDFGMSFGSAHINNYSITYPTDIIGKINKKEIEITPDAGQNKMFGKCDPKFLFTASDTLIFGNSFSGSLEREDGEDVGTYAFTIGNLDAGDNYTLTLIEGEIFEINRASPALPEFIELSAVYGQTLNDIDISDLLSEMYTDGSFAWIDDLNTDVGTVLNPTDNLSLKFTPMDQHNLTETTVSVVLTVMPKLLTWNSDGTVKDKTYDGNTVAEVLDEPTLSGILSNDEVSVKEGAVDFEFADAGNHPVFAENWEISGNDASNYKIDEQPIFDFGTINQRDIYLTNFNLTKIYDGNDEVRYFGAELSFEGLVVGETATVNTSEVMATYDQINVDTDINITFNGDFVMTEGTAKASNYKIIQPTALEGEITPRELIIEGFAISKIYDGNVDVINGLGTLVFVGFVVGETAEVDETGIANAMFSTPNYGVHTITFYGDFAMNTDGSTNPQNYQIIQPTEITGKIEKRELAITPDAGQNKVFGEFDPEFSYAKSEPLIDGNSFTGTLGRTAGENIGKYAINLGNLSAGNNYTLILEHETFEIIPADPVVPPFVALSAVYGQTLDNVNISSLPSDLNLIGSFAWKQPISTLVGTATTEGFPRDEFSLIFTPNNLDFAQAEIPVVLTVARRPLMWNAMGTVNSKVYDGNRNAEVLEEPTFNGILSGDIDEITVRCTVRFSSQNVGNNHSVIVDNWTVEGSAVSNYEFPMINPNFRLGTITRRPITIENFEMTKVYDGNDAVIGGFGALKLVGLVEGEEATIDTINILNPTYSSSDVGAHEILYSGNFTMLGITAIPNNYLIIQPSSIFGTITARALTIEAEGISKVYDGDNLVTNFGILTFDGFIEGETAEVDFSEVDATYESKNAGTHLITFSENFALTGGNAKAINYEIIHPTKIKGDITNRPLTIVGFEISKIYDGNTLTDNNFDNLTFEGLVDGEELEVDVLNITATYTHSDAGIHPIIFSDHFAMMGDHEIAKNYFIEQPEITGTITVKSITIVFPNISKTYDGNEKVTNFGTPTFVGLVDDETATVNTSDVNAIYADVDVDENINITFISGKFTMDVNGIANPNNYDIIQPEGNVVGNITPRELFVTGSGISKIYDGDVEVKGGFGTFMFEGFVNGETAEVDADIDGAIYALKDFGSHLITFEGNFVMMGGTANPNNYEIIHPTEIEGQIEKKTVTISFPNISKTYDGNEKVTSFGTPIFADLVDGESATVNTSQGRAIYADANAETEIEITFLEESYFSMNAGGTANPINYKIIQPVDEVTGAITPKSLIIFPDFGQYKVYQAGDPLSFTYTMSETLIDGNYIVCELGREEGEDIGLYRYTIETWCAGKNYSLTVGGIARFEIIEREINLPASPIRLTAIYGQTLNDIHIANLLDDGDYDEGEFTWVQNSTMFVGTVTAEHYPNNEFSLLFTPEDGNLNTTTIQVALTVVPASLTWNDDGKVNSKIYDGNTDATVWIRQTLSGILFNDDVSIKAGTVHFADANAGIHEVVTQNWGIEGDDAFNYKIVGQPKFADQEIIPETLTISGFNISKIYDGNENVINGFGELSFVGLIGDETAMVNITEVTAIYNQTDVGDDIEITFVGEFNMMFEGGTANPNNYNILQPTEIEGIITKKTLTWNISGTVNSKNYDGTTSCSVATLPALYGIIGGDDVIVVATAEFANSSANENASVNVKSWSIIGADTGNYIIQGQPTFSNGIITPKPLSWIINGSVNSKTYNGNTNATLQTQNRPTLSGILDEDVADVRVVVGSVRFESPDANPNANLIAENWNIEGNFAHNYSISEQPEFPAVEISRRSVTIAGFNITKIYDGNDEVTNFGMLRFNNLVVGETAEVDFLSAKATYSEPNFGTRNITFNGDFEMIDGNANPDNYVITQPSNITGRIEKREIVITPTSGQNKVFGEDDPEFLFTSSEDLFAENDFEGSLGREPGDDVGFYQFVLGNLDAGNNYEFVFIDGIEFEITKKPIVMPTVIEGLVYTGIPQTGILQNDHAAYYTVSGNRQTNAGHYTATVTLRDTQNTEWTNKTTDNLALNWSIDKDDLAIPQPPKGLMAVVGELISTVVLPANWTWQNPNDLVGEAGVQTHLANYNPNPQNFNTYYDIEVEILVADDRIDLSDANPPLSGLGWTFSSTTEIYTVTGTNAVSVVGSNNPSQRRIKVVDDATVTINFNNVNISGLGDGQSAILLGNNTIATLDFTGENNLEGGANGSGISGGTVIINKGVVTTTGKNGKHGIDAMLEMNGHAIVFASSASDLSEKTSGILVVSDNTYWYGNTDFTLLQNVIVPAGYMLTIPNLHTLTIPNTITLTNNGRIVENCGSVIMQAGGIFEGNQIAIIPACMSDRLLKTLAIDRLEAAYGDRISEITLPENWYWTDNTDRFVGDASVNGSTDEAFVKFISSNPIYSDVTDIPVDVFVLQKDLWINVTDFDISKIYDGNTTIESGFGDLTFEGFVRGETANVDLSNVTATYISADFGTHEITFTGDFAMLIGEGTANPSNYNIIQPAGITGNITKKPITISGFDIMKVYDGGTTVEGDFGALKFEGLVGEQTANVDISNVLATYDLPDFGTHDIVFSGNFTMTGGPANPNNYEITHPNNITGFIAKRELAITGSGISKIYDGNNIVEDLGTFVFEGLVVGETAIVNTSDITGATYSSPDFGTHNIVFNGSFAMTENTAKASNYTIIQPTEIKGDIAKKPITIDFSITKIYDGNYQVTSFGTPRFVGLVGGQTSTVNTSGVIANYTQSDVGTNIGIEFSFTEGEFSMNAIGSTNPSNYYIVQPTNEVTGTITRRTLTITPSSGQTKRFGDIDPELTYTHTPTLIAGNEFSGRLGREAGEDVGQYVINLGNLSAGNNYNVVLSGNTRFFEITSANPILPESIELTAVYGDSLSHIDLSSLLTEMHTPGSFVWVQTNRPVGTVTPDNLPRRNFTLRFLPTQSQNFISTIVEVALTVTPKPLSWSTSGTIYTKNYDGTRNAQVLTSPTLFGVLQSDLSNVSVRAGTVRFESANAGIHPIEVQNWGIVGNNAFNYEIIGQPEFENGTITPRSVTITGSGITKTYDGNNMVKGSLGSFEFSGFVVNETANVNTIGITSATYESRDFGTHNITFEGDFAMIGGTANPDNYSIAHPITIKGDITKQILTIAGNGISKIYDGNNSILGGFGDLRFIGLVGDETATVNTSGITNATYASSDFGTHNIVFAGNFAMTEGTAKAINYDIIHPIDIFGDIERKKLVWSSEGTVYEKTYDGSTTATISELPKLSEIIKDEDISVIVSVRFADAKAGQNVNVIVTNWNITGSGANNYEITGEPTFTYGTINRKTLTWNVAGTVHEKDYDGTTAAEVATQPRLSGLISGDDVSVRTSVEFENPNANPNTKIIIKNWSIEGRDTSNYQINGNPEFSNGIVRKKALTWVSAGTVYRKIYDGTIEAEIATQPVLFGVVGGDVRVNTSVRFANSNANQIVNVIVTNWSIEGAGVNNYDIFIEPRFSAGRIDQRPITIIPDVGQKKAFGDVDPMEFSYNHTALIGSDYISGRLERESGENAGRYPFNIGTLTAGNNYALALHGNVTFEITQAETVFEAIPLTAVYGQTLSHINLPLWSSKFQTEGIFSWEQPLNTDVGTVTTPRNNLSLKFTPDNPNFKIIENIPVTLTVFPKSISWNTIDIEGNHGTVENKDYDGTTNATIATLPTLLGIINNDIVNVTATVRFADIYANDNVSLNVISWNIEGIGASNYKLLEGPKFSAATISQKLVRITGFDIYKEYDGTTEFYGDFGALMFEGLVNGETADVCTANVTSTFASHEEGTHLKIFEGFFGMIGGTAVASNYNIEHPTDVEGVIVPKSEILHVHQSRIEMKVYPNPVDRGHLIWFEVDADLDFLEGAKIEVYNTLGARMDVIRVQGRRTAIESSRFKPGMYILVLSTKNGFRQEVKLVVK
jgi:hypothetical protein